MVITRIIKHHISKGETIAASLADRFDYGQNHDKTDGGELIRAYECDHETADAEFTLAKWTIGRHAFFVATHIDRSHIHNHIYYNSTALDCTRKFRDFLGSARAVRRLSDRVGLENNLSVVLDPKLKSKGQFKHYGEWLGTDKLPTFQERLKAAIDAALSEQPKDFDAFLEAMTAAGFEHKWGRSGVLSFCTEGQERFTRLRASTLGDGYGLEDIRTVIEGCAVVPECRARSI